MIKEIAVVGLPGFEPESIEPKSTSLSALANMDGLSRFLFIGWAVWLYRLFG